MIFYCQLKLGNMKNRMYSCKRASLRRMEDAVERLLSQFVSSLNSKLAILVATW